MSTEPSKFMSPKLIDQIGQLQSKVFTLVQTLLFFYQNQRLALLATIMSARQSPVKSTSPTFPTSYTLSDSEKTSLSGEQRPLLSGSERWTVFPQELTSTESILVPQGSKKRTQGESRRASRLVWLSTLIQSACIERQNTFTRNCSPAFTTSRMSFIPSLFKSPLKPPQIGSSCLGRAVAIKLFLEGLQICKKACFQSTASVSMSTKLSELKSAQASSLLAESLGSLTRDSQYWGKKVLAVREGLAEAVQSKYKSISIFIFFHGLPFLIAEAILPALVGGHLDLLQHSLDRPLVPRLPHQVLQSCLTIPALLSSHFRKEGA